MLSLHTNASSLSTLAALGRTQSELTTSQTRLGSGFRVNSAMDDAAGVQIATRLDAQSRGQAVAMRNAQNGISMMQTAEGAFGEVTNILQRMKDLATQSADGTSNQKDRDSMQLEYDALGQELHNISYNTSFGGNKLLQGGTLASAVTYQIGAGSAETMTVDLSADMTTADGAAAGGLGKVSAQYTAQTALGTGTEVASQGSANAIIDDINSALDTVGKIRAQLGAASNRLDHVFNNLSNMSTNTTQARGRIMDVDYASESANMTSKQMLLQASTAMLKQSGSMSQLTLSLLQ
ncbi:MAG TPA: flagellin [Burkholderiaceae bacterium]|nr:flagellin [Burkholderiaceae bacterium]